MGLRFESFDIEETHVDSYRWRSGGGVEVVLTTDR